MLETLYLFTPLLFSWRIQLCLQTEAIYEEISEVLQCNRNCKLKLIKHFGDYLSHCFQLNLTKLSLDSYLSISIQHNICINWKKERNLNHFMQVTDQRYFNRFVKIRQETIWSYRYKYCFYNLLNYTYFQVTELKLMISRLWH